MSATTRPAFTVHPGSGPYLVLLHGFLSSSRQWKHNLGALQEICTPVTVDLLGHGNSPAPTDPAPYHPQAYIDALEHIRRTLDTTQWFVGGYSLGAGITIRYSHQYPERVLAHFFTNSASAFADAELKARWRKDAQSTAERVNREGIAAIRRIPVHPRFAKRLPQDIYDVLLEDAERLSPTGVANTMAHTTPNASIRDIAGENPRPALLCHGALEQRFAASKAWAEQHMAELTIAELNTGHPVNMEDSEGFNKAVTQFIMRHMPG